MKVKIEEPKILIDTALLAKEKGIDIIVGWEEWYYDTEHDNTFIHGSELHYPSELNYLNFTEETEDQKEYLRWEKTLIKGYTQALLQKYLRENHMLHPAILTTECGYFTYKIIDIQMNPENQIERPPYSGVCANDYVKYEEALENALVEMMNMI